MRRLTGTIVIDRPIEEVFAFLADGENDIKFSPRLTSIERTTPEGTGVGATYRSTAREMGSQDGARVPDNRVRAPGTGYAGRS